jgi:hypothetical protein
MSDFPQELQQKRLAGDKVENRLIARGKEREKKVLAMGESLEQE